MSSTASSPSSAQGSVARDTRLDALRGFFLVIMIIDHLSGTLSRYAYEFIGFVSAAEGFILLSGYVTGMSFARTAQSGAGSLWPKTWQRIRNVWLAHVATFLALYLTLRLFPAMRNESWRFLFEMPAIEAVGLGLTFLQQPQYLDVLPMYCLFQLLVPPVVSQCRKGRAPVVLYVSFMVWGWAQLGLHSQLERLLRTAMPVRLGDFDVFAWQFLFVCGVCWGSQTAQNGFPFAPFPNQPAAVWLIAVPGAAILFIWRWGILSLPDFGHWQNIGITHEKKSLGLIRLVNLALVIWCLGARRARSLPDLAAGGLTLLGRQSLAVFSAHVLLASWIAAGAESAPPTADVALTGLALAACFATAATAELVRAGRSG